VRGKSNKTDDVSEWSFLKECGKKAAKRIRLVRRDKMGREK